MKLRYGKNAGKVFNIGAFDKPFELGGVQMTFIPAGHMLGSAQILMEYQCIKYLYTGDYKLQADKVNLRTYRVGKNRCADY